MTTTCHVCERPAPNAYLCRSCLDTLDQALADLASLIDDVTTAATRQARVYRGAGAAREQEPDWRGSEYALIRTPWVVDLDAAALLHRARNEVTTWARHLTETRDVELVRASISEVFETRTDVLIRRNRAICVRTHVSTISRGYTRGLTDLIAWLRGQLDTIALDEAAAPMLNALTRLRDDLTRAVDRRPSRIYAGPCHARIDVMAIDVRDGTVYSQLHRDQRCDRQLYATVNPWAERDEADGDEAKIVCDGWRPDGRRPDDHGCGATYTATDRQEWLLASIDDALLTIDELLPVLPRMFPDYPRPPKTVVQAWVRQGRLAVKAVTAGAVERFRGGDMLDLVQAYRPHAYAPRRRRMSA